MNVAHTRANMSNSDPGGRSPRENESPGVSPARIWLTGARPRTLPAAVVPVAVGTAVAATDGTVVWWRAALALVVSLALQVSVNYANDYSDGVRGTDDVRVGPIRLVASGLASPAAVKRAALLAGAVGAVAGAALALVTTPWVFLVGFAALVSAWTYTGGPKPYGYIGLGELFVFVFFGLAAVVGSTFVQREHLLGLSWAAAVPVGLLAVALLLVNNLRDIPGDTIAGKRTLAVRIGAPGTRSLYAMAVLLPLALLPVLMAFDGGSPWVLIGLAAVVAVLAPLRVVSEGAQGRSLIAALAGTGRYQLVYGLLLSFGLLIGVWTE